METSNKDHHSEAMDGSLESHSVDNSLLQLQKRVAALESVALTAKSNSFLLQLSNSLDSIIGLREAFISRQPCLRFTWLLLVCGGLIGTAYFMNATIDEYRENPTLTKVVLGTYDLYEYPPLITCSQAWFDTEKALSLGLSLDGLKYSFSFLDSAYAPPLKIWDIDEGRKNFQEVYTRNFTSLADFYRSIAVQLEPQHSKKGFFNSTSPSYLVNGEANVTQVFSPYGSICHAFRFRPVDGKSRSLIQPETVHIKYGDKSGGMASARQWLLHFNNGATARFTLPLIVPSAARVHLKMQAQNFIRLSNPKNPCLEGRYTTRSGADCTADCLNDFYMEQFQCRLFFMTVDKDQEPGDQKNFCTALDLISTNRSAAAAMVQSANGTNSTDKSMDTFHRRVISNQVKDACTDKCPRHCDRLVYEAALQGIDLDYDEFRQEEEMLAGHENMSVTTFSILHDAMRQGGVLTFTEVRSYSFIQLTNNVGGTLGLFVGGALMTLVQLIIFLLNYFMEKMAEKRIQKH